METNPNETPNENTPLPDILQPIQVITAEVPQAQPEIEVPPGYVLLVALNEDGTDIPNSEFFYPEKSYKRFYSNEQKYRVKKKLN